MIVNSSLKTSIVYVMNKNTAFQSLSDCEKCATEVIFYKYMVSLVNNNVTVNNNINTLIENYASNYIYKFSSLKDKYNCYLNIINYIYNINKYNILQLLENEIDYIYNEYINMKEIIDFDINYFNSSMYNLYNCDNKTLNYLSNIHYNIMIPIIKYYMKLYGCKSNDMKIISTNSTGKAITFHINNISSTQIYKDLKLNKFPISISEAYLEYPNIKIINS